MKVVEYDDPIEVDVAGIVNERHGWTGQPELRYARVPGQYGAEWRCTDVAACKGRQHAMVATAQPVGHGASPSDSDAASVALSLEDFG